MQNRIVSKPNVVLPGEELDKVDIVVLLLLLLSSGGHIMDEVPSFVQNTRLAFTNFL